MDSPFKLPSRQARLLLPYAALFYCYRMQAQVSFCPYWKDVFRLILTKMNSYLIINKLIAYIHKFFI